MDYRKEAISSKLEAVVYGDSRGANQREHLLKLFIVFLVLLAVLSVGALSIGALVGIIDNSPEIESLTFSPSGYASVSYDIDGNPVATFVQEGSNREEAVFEELPDDLINAFVAIEDQRFWEHNGIDLRSITRAIKGIVTGDSSAGGGSTLTQQLIKNNVFSGGNEDGFELYERKFQEWYIALKLENQPGTDKEQVKKTIITDYLNTINLGNNTLGVKVAAKRYFGKEVSELNLEECTVLASITKNPTKLNPIKHPEENQKRRLQVLKDMEEQGYITAEEREAASGMDIYSTIMYHNDNDIHVESAINSYFTDELVEQCIEVFKERLGMTEAEAKELLYSGGLKIMTTQDPKLQAIVDEEINNPENYDTAKLSFKWRCSVRHRNGSLKHYSENDIESYAISQKGIKNYDGLFKTEDEITELIEEYKKTVINEEDGDEIEAETFDTTLQPQISFVLIDQSTKEVKAISGGRGEKKYSLTLNRATNTYRQPGSTFKVVSSFAPALEENGATLGTCYYDSPYTLGSKTFRNWWSGDNYFGYSSIRDGIEFSMNIVAVKCMVETVTPEAGVDFAKSLGITSLMDEDKNAATSLGGLTKGVSNLELTNAFASIADGGLYGKPIFFTKIFDHSGNLLIDMTDEPKSRVMKETTAFLLTDAMKNSVIGHNKWAESFTVANTSSRARLDNMACAGKSGTTTKNVDVWFVGYTPYYTAGIWTGCDDNQSLKDSSTGQYNGGTSFHKDIWKKIMTRVHEGYEYMDFEVPDGIVKVDVCRKSGMIPHSGCLLDVRNDEDAVYTEYFDADNVPTKTCTHHTKEGTVIIPEIYANYETDDGGHNTSLEEQEELISDFPGDVNISTNPSLTNETVELNTGSLAAPGIDLSRHTGPGQN